ncbi:MAG: hypothetical protein ACR2QR_12105 [Woeseiaceae bacterium]
MKSKIARSLVLLVICSFGAVAQESEEPAPAEEIDSFEPAVSSEELSGMDSTETESVEPAVPTAVLAQDVRRTASSTGVMDEIDLGRTEITGNQELPKVLYIVPWQKSEAGELVGKPVNTLLEEVLAPIDRTEFIRQVDYYGDLYRDEEQ